MRVVYLIFIAIIITLTSCEGIVHLQGYVYERGTKKPFKNAQVILILKNKDTMRDIYFEYDTLSYNQRIALRKTGVKDDYKMYNAGGLSKKPSPCYTDTNGHLNVGSILISCTPKCPNCQLLVLKEGYRPLYIQPNSIINDSMNISFELLTYK